MIDYWRGDVVDCMRHEEEKIIQKGLAFLPKYTLYR